MQPLRAKIHTSVQFETSSPNLQCRKNSNILPRNKGGSATDSMRKSDLPKRLSVGAIDFVAGVRSKATGIDIQYAMCGHGGERWFPREAREGGKMKTSPVDRYNPKTKTVFQYHGCHFHRCPKCYPHR